jgi:hypothetical protein
MTLRLSRLLLLAALIAVLVVTVAAEGDDVLIEDVDEDHAEERAMRRRKYGIGSAKPPSAADDDEVDTDTDIDFDSQDASDSVDVDFDTDAAPTAAADDTDVNVESATGGKPKSKKEQKADRDREYYGGDNDKDKGKATKVNLSPTPTRRRPKFSAGLLGKAEAAQFDADALVEDLGMGLPNQMQYVEVDESQESPMALLRATAISSAPHMAGGAAVDAKKSSSIKYAIQGARAEIKRAAAKVKKDAEELKKKLLAGDSKAKPLSRKQSDAVAKHATARDKAGVLLTKAQEVLTTATATQTQQLVLHRHAIRSALLAFPAAKGLVDGQIALVQEALRGVDDTGVLSAELREQRKERRQILKQLKEQTDGLAAVRKSIVMHLSKREPMTASEAEDALWMAGLGRRAPAALRELSVHVMPLTLRVFGLTVHELCVLLICVAVPFQAYRAAASIGLFALNSMSFFRGKRRDGNGGSTASDRAKHVAALRRTRRMWTIAHGVVSAALFATVLLYVDETAVNVFPIVTPGSVLFVWRYAVSATQQCFTLALVAALHTLQVSLTTI